MQASSGIEAMGGWNRYSDWPSAWKEGGVGGLNPGLDGGAAARGWFEPATDIECVQPQYDVYGSWGQHGGVANGYTDLGAQMRIGGLGGAGGQMHNMYGLADHEANNMIHHMIDQQGLPVSHLGARLNGFMDNGHQQHLVGNGYQNDAPSSGITSGGMSAGSSSSYRANVVRPGQCFGNCSGGSGSDSEDDPRLARSPEDGSSRRGRQPPGGNSDDEDDGPQRPTEATAEEREEAEQVVRVAFKEAKEREKLREKVKKASPGDLQALLNARLGKR